MSSSWNQKVTRRTMCSVQRSCRSWPLLLMHRQCLPVLPAHPLRAYAQAACAPRFGAVQRSVSSCLGGRKRLWAASRPPHRPEAPSAPARKESGRRLRAVGSAIGAPPGLLPHHRAPIPPIAGTAWFPCSTGSKRGCTRISRKKRRSRAADCPHPSDARPGRTPPGPHLPSRRLQAPCFWLRPGRFPCMSCRGERSKPLVRRRAPQMRIPPLPRAGARHQPHAGPPRPASRRAEVS